MTLTRRCPLTCAHCSTNSTMGSEEHSASMFIRFAQTLSDRPPAIVWLTGGEPLLRPKLVRQLAAQAHAYGARVAMITGMFYARDGRMPVAIRRTIDVVDHLVVSQDIYHEVQVPRENVFRIVSDLVNDGKQVSFHIVGRDGADPYLAEITREIRDRFEDRVPALVAPLGRAGRAAEWLPPAPRPTRESTPLPYPCTMAAWPVVTPDGTVVACCNQYVVDGSGPEHLRLGHASTDTWGTVRSRCLELPMLRALRTLGPENIMGEYGDGPAACTGYCSTCQHLSDSPALAQRINRAMERPALRLIESHVQDLQLREGPRAFVSRYAIPEYANMVLLGREESVGN